MLIHLQTVEKIRCDSHWSLVEVAVGLWTLSHYLLVETCEVPRRKNFDTSMCVSLPFWPFDSRKSRLMRNPT